MYLILSVIFILSACPAHAGSPEREAAAQSSAWSSGSVGQQFQAALGDNRVEETRRQIQNLTRSVDGYCILLKITESEMESFARPTESLERISERVRRTTALMDSSLTDFAAPQSAQRVLEQLLRDPAGLRDERIHEEARGLDESVRLVDLFPLEQAVRQLSSALFSRHAPLDLLDDVSRLMEQIQSHRQTLRQVAWLSGQLERESRKFSLSH